MRPLRRDGGSCMKVTCSQNSPEMLPQPEIIHLNFLDTPEIQKYIDFKIKHWCSTVLKTSANIVLKRNLPNQKGE